MSAVFWLEVFEAEDFLSIGVFVEFGATAFAVVAVEVDGAEDAAVWTGVAGPEEEESARRLRILGSAMMATIIKTTAKSGTT